MKGLKKFKESLPECNREGIIKIFEWAMYYGGKCKDRSHNFRDIYKASLDAYEGCIYDIGLWNKYKEYRELKASSTSPTLTNP